MNFEVVPKASPESEPDEESNPVEGGEKSVDSLVEGYEDQISGYDEAELESEIGSLVGFIAENQESAVDNPAREAVIDAHRRKVWMAEELLEQKRKKGELFEDDEEDLAA